MMKRWMFWLITAIVVALVFVGLRAKKKDKFLESVLKQREKYDDLYNEAVRLTEMGAYSQSNENLVQILDGKNIDEKYYSQVRKDARELQERNNSILEQIRIQNQQAAIRRQREQQRQEEARKAQQAAASSSSSAENQNDEPKKSDDKNDDRNSGQDNVKNSLESKPETNNSAAEPQPNNENK